MFKRLILVSDRQIFVLWIFVTAILAFKCLILWPKRSRDRHTEKPSTIAKCTKNTIHLQYYADRKYNYSVVNFVKLHLTACRSFSRAELRFDSRAYTVSYHKSRHFWVNFRGLNSSALKLFLYLACQTVKCLCFDLLMFVFIEKEASLQTWRSHFLMKWVKVR